MKPTITAACVSVVRLRAATDELVAAIEERLAFYEYGAGVGPDSPPSPQWARVVAAIAAVKDSP